MHETADRKIVEFLAANGYHPRSSKHGDAICEFLILDLMRHCPSFSHACAEGRIVAQSNFTIDPDSPDRWNVDLVVGPPGKERAKSTEMFAGVPRSDPSEIWIAIDAKTIMTEHGKARRNRQRDLNSFQDILHRKSPRTIVGGLLVVNVAERFQTPLARASGPVTEHKNVKRLVSEIGDLMGGLPRASEEPGTPGLEGLGVVVVSHTNIPGDRTTLLATPPAPANGHPLHYQSFLRDICAAFTKRFGK